MSSRPDESIGVTRDLLAACLLKAGRVEELCRLSSADADVCYWQGLAYAHQELPDRAVAKLRKALALQPDHERAQVALTTVSEQVFLDQIAKQGWLLGGNGHSAARSVSFVEATAHEAEDDTKLIKTAVSLLAGQREEAVHVLENALNRDPNDSTVLHSMGLASYYAARVLSKEDRARDADHFWRRAVAAWVALLNEETFWEVWQVQIEERYEVEIGPQDMSLFRKHLEDSLSRLLLHMSNSVSEIDRPGQNNHQNSHVRKGEYERLLHREMKAAASLRQVGGFAVPGDNSKKLICGPLMIQLLGWETEFGQFIAELPVREHDVSEELLDLLDSLLNEEWEHFEEGLSPRLAQKRKLKRYFSQLGMAQAMLDLSRPEEALEALNDISCEVCRSDSQYRQSPSTFGENQIISCAADCPNFDHANSSYAGSVDKEFSLTLDATELAIEAHLAAAQLTLTAAEMNVETACIRWKQATKMASQLGAEYFENTQRQIVNAALGRSAALHGDNRLDEAIALLEQAEHIGRHRHREELRSRLGELLTNRGIKAGNNEPPNWSAAARDLRRAVDLNPHAVRPRISLCIVLNSWAGQELDRDNEHTAITLLEEVVNCVNKAGSANANHPNLQRELDDANEVLSMIYNMRGVRLADEKNWTAAIRALDSAIKFAPRAEIVQRNLKQIYRNYAFDFLECGQPMECIQVLRTALSRFPNDQTLQEDLIEILSMLKAIEGRRY